MRKKTLYTIFVLAIIAMASLLFVYGDPEGANVQYISNTSKNTSSPQSRTDNKGTITTVLISTTQQNIRWKAYVGNVSGTLVLRDSESYSIYEWAGGGSPDGEVYITRNSTVDWSTIQCANDTQITTEQGILGHSGTAADNINNTFAVRRHENITIGTTNILNSTCKSTFTWINNTAQTPSQTGLFQEILMMDSSGRIVYTALINQDTSSYRADSATSNNTYDFQAIVPDNAGAAITTYYFYVEITS